MTFHQVAFMSRGCQSDIPQLAFLQQGSCVRPEISAGSHSALYSHLVGKPD